MQRFVITLLLLAVALSIPSCRRKAKAQIPVFIPPTPSPPEAAPMVEEPAPTPEMSNPEVPPLWPAGLSPEGQSETALEPPPAPVAEPNPPPPPAPRLTPLLGEEERRRFLLEADASLARAQRQVAAIARRTLDAEQQASLDRIHAFIEQAGALRQTDLVTAHGLARRADILSAELLESSR